MFTFDVPTPHDLFIQYDADGSGGVQKAEFKQMLLDLDGLQGIPHKSIDGYVEQEFAVADLNHDELVSIDELYLYYYATLCFKFPVGRDGVNPGADLYNIFVRYCSFGKSTRYEEMESNQFMRLSKECQLTNGLNVTRATVDCVYARARASRMSAKELGAAKLQYNQFLHALMLLGEKRQTGFQEVVSRILHCASAKPIASMADLLTFSNLGSCQNDCFLERPRGLPQPPASTLTAAAAGTLAGSKPQQVLFTQEVPQRYAGSPLPLPASSSRYPSAEQLATANAIPAGGASGGSYNDDFEDAGGDSGGLNLQSTVSNVDPNSLTSTVRKQWGFETAGDMDLGSTGSKALHDTHALLNVRRLHYDELTMVLKRVFEKYNSWEHGVNKSEMDKMRFQKVMRDCELLDEQAGGLSGQEVGKIFGRCKPGSRTALNFFSFMEGLRHVAVRKRLSLNEVMERIVLVGGPVDSRQDSARVAHLQMLTSLAT